MNKFVVILLSSFVLLSCKTKEKVTVTADGTDLPYRKVVKQSDYKLKFQYAEKYFANEDYYRAQTLYEEVIAPARTEAIGRTAYYKYAECHYRQKDYYLAGYYFKQFNKQNSFDPRAEEALFKSAICKVKVSPEYSLDATETQNAIDQLQLYLDKYPDTEYADTCNQIIDKLIGKLEVKKYEIAMLYFKTENYKSAVVMYDVFLEEFPQSKYKESVLFHKVKSGFLLANYSVLSKKSSRYEETIKSYHNFVSAFPESKYMKEANAIHENAQRKLGLPTDK